jgi:hypothetical protein
MIRSNRLTAAALRLLARLAARSSVRADNSRSAASADLLIQCELASHKANGELAITPAGRAHAARRAALAEGHDIDPFRAQHFALASRDVEGPAGISSVTVDESESPLAWLARRKGRDGCALIEPHQLAAGEQLRAEFTRAHLMPRVTSNWQAAVSRGARGAAASGAAAVTDTIIAARQRVRSALNEVGPEFAGLLVDVCCFLKGLEDVERERRWPPRSAKVVLQLALERLARYYGLGAQATGRERAPVRVWAPSDSKPKFSGDALEN